MIYLAMKLFTSLIITDQSVMIGDRVYGQLVFVCAQKTKYIENYEITRANIRIELNVMKRNEIDVRRLGVAQHTAT